MIGGLVGEQGWCRRSGEQVAVDVGCKDGVDGQDRRVEEHLGVEGVRAAGADRRPAGEQGLEVGLGVQAQQVEGRVGQAGPGEQYEEVAVELLQSGAPTGRVAVEGGDQGRRSAGC